jgi:hypothetical protein
MSSAVGFLKVRESMMIEETIFIDKWAVPVFDA